MKIEDNALYANRTWKYLFPCLKEYGPILMSRLASFFKLAVGISDTNVVRTNPCLFILINTNFVFSNPVEVEKYKNNFSKFLDWVRYQPYYETDYVYEGLDIDEKHMVVLKIPPKFESAYQNFLTGNYSKMYSEEDVYKYFHNISILNNKEVEDKLNERIENTRKVLLKDNVYLSSFVKKVNTEFGTNTEEKHFERAELDYPPKLFQETFNYIKKHENNSN